MGNKRKGKASHGPRARKAAAQRNASGYEERTGGDTIQRAAGRVVHEDAVRRGGLASEACRNRALQARVQSRAHAADAKWKSRDAAKQFPRWRRACIGRESSGLRPKLSR